MAAQEDIMLRFIGVDAATSTIRSVTAGMIQLGTAFRTTETSVKAFDASMQQAIMGAQRMQTAIGGMLGAQISAAQGFEVTVNRVSATLGQFGDVHEGLYQRIKDNMEGLTIDAIRMMPPVYQRVEALTLSMSGLAQMTGEMRQKIDEQIPRWVFWASVMGYNEDAIRSALNLSLQFGKGVEGTTYVLELMATAAVETGQDVARMGPLFVQLGFYAQQAGMDLAQFFGMIVVLTKAGLDLEQSVFVLFGLMIGFSAMADQWSMAADKIADAQERWEDQTRSLSRAHSDLSRRLVDIQRELDRMPATIARTNEDFVRQIQDLDAAMSGIGRQRVRTEEDRYWQRVTFALEEYSVGLRAGSREVIAFSDTQDLFNKLLEQSVGKVDFVGAATAEIREQYDDLARSIGDVQTQIEEENALWRARRGIFAPTAEEIVRHHYRLEELQGRQNELQEQGAGLAQDAAGDIAQAHISEARAFMDRNRAQEDYDRTMVDLLERQNRLQADRLRAVQDYGWAIEDLASRETRLEQDRIRALADLEVAWRKYVKMVEETYVALLPPEMQIGIKYGVFEEETPIDMMLRLAEVWQQMTFREQIHAGRLVGGVIGMATMQKLEEALSRIPGAKELIAEGLPTWEGILDMQIAQMMKTTEVAEAVKKGAEYKLKVEVGDEILTPLRAIHQELTKIYNWLSGAPQPLQAIFVGIETALGALAQLAVMGGTAYMFGRGIGWFKGGAGFPRIGGGAAGAAEGAVAAAAPAVGGLQETAWGWRGAGGRWVPPPGFGPRFTQTVGRMLGFGGRGFGRALGPAGIALYGAYTAWDIMEEPTRERVARGTGAFGGGVLGGIAAGAGAGALAGMAGGPAAPVTVPLAAIIGGIIGGFAGTFVGEQVGALVEEHWEPIKEFTLKWGEFLPVVSDVAGVFESTAELLDGVQEGFGAVEALFAGDMEDFSEHMTSMGEHIGKFLLHVTVLGGIARNWDTIVNSFETAWGVIESGLDTAAGALGDKVGDFGEWISDFGTWIEKFGEFLSPLKEPFEKLGEFIDRIGDLIGLLGGGPVGVAQEVGKGLLDVLGDIAEGATGWIPGVPWGQDGGFVGREGLAYLHAGEAVIPAAIVDAIRAAIGITGVPKNWFSGLSQLAFGESGFDPRAVNPVAVEYGGGWGSQHATGLFQTMPPTFMQYAMVGFGDIFDPLDNAIAAIRYIIANYGSVSNALAGWEARGGYQEGAWDVAATRFARVDAGEMIIPATYASAIRSVVGGGGGGTVDLKLSGSATIYMQFPDGSRMAISDRDKREIAGLVISVLEDLIPTKQRTR